MARTKKSTNGNGRVITTQAQMDKAIWSICNILRRDKCKGARLYVPELNLLRRVGAIARSAMLFQEMAFWGQIGMRRGEESGT